MRRGRVWRRERDTSPWRRSSPVPRETHGQSVIGALVSEERRRVHDVAQIESHHDTDEDRQQENRANKARWSAVRRKSTYVSDVTRRSTAGQPRTHAGLPASTPRVAVPSCQPAQSHPASPHTPAPTPRSGSPNCRRSAPGGGRSRAGVGAGRARAAGAAPRRRSAGASSATSASSPSVTSIPSAPSVVVTTGVPQDQASMILTRIPAPACSGTRKAAVSAR